MRNIIIFATLVIVITGLIAVWWGVNPNDNLSSSNNNTATMVNNSGTFTFDNQETLSNNTENNTQNDSQEKDSSTADGSAYSWSEVRSHQEPADCWVVIDGVVYDMSNFSTVHPGGQSPIEQSCGTDATELFSNRNGRGSHPSSSQQELSKRKIGIIEEE